MEEVAQGWMVSLFGKTKAKGSDSISVTLQPYRCPDCHSLLKWGMGIYIYVQTHFTTRRDM